jgi:uncharacterized protein DUF6894
MQTYYFDMKDGVPTRDRVGLLFSNDAAAIEHGKQLARQLRGDPRINEPNLYVSIVDETGREVHRELVYKGASRNPGQASCA